MKEPMYPKKPYPPYKPTPPKEKEDRTERCGDFQISQYTYYTLEEFTHLISSNLKDGKSIDDKCIRLEFSAEKDYDSDTTINCQMLNIVEVDNPVLDKQTKLYKELLAKYNIEMEQFKIDDDKFKEELKVYDAENIRWMLEQAKLTVKRLEAKVNKQP